MGVVGGATPFHPGSTASLAVCAEMASILAAQGVGYVDALLIHWPTATAPSSDPVCNKGSAYNATACRLQ